MISEIGNLRKEFNSLKVEVSFSKISAERVNIAHGEYISINTNVEVNSDTLDEERTITRLNNDTPEENPDHFCLIRGEQQCILLKMYAGPLVFKNEDVFKVAVDKLVKRIIEAGEIDTNVKQTLDVKFTFTSPLTNEQMKVVCSMLSKHGHLKDKNVPSSSGNLPFRADKRKRTETIYETMTQHHSDEVPYKKSKYRQPTRSPSGERPHTSRRYKEKEHYKTESESAKSVLWNQKQNLIRVCQNEVGHISSKRRPLNIAVIGPPGCGKSSFLNTIFASVSDERWREIAPYGDHGGIGRQVSQYFVSYPKKTYYSRERGEEKEDDILMPTFIDMNGFEDSGSEFNEEILRMVIFGKMREGEKITQILNCYKETDIRHVRKIYGQRKENLKVDRIIFVCSADPVVPLPVNLMRCLCEVAHRDIDIPIYGVLTKIDKFNPKTTPPVLEKEIKFRENLGIPMNRFASVKNYCADVNPEMTFINTVLPEIDVNILQFMTQVFSSAIHVARPVSDPYEVSKPPEEPEEEESIGERLIQEKKDRTCALF